MNSSRDFWQSDQDFSAWVVNWGKKLYPHFEWLAAEPGWWFYYDSFQVKIRQVCWHPFRKRGIILVWPFESVVGQFRWLRPQRRVEILRRVLAKAISKLQIVAPAVEYPIYHVDLWELDPGIYDEVRQVISHSDRVR